MSDEYIDMEDLEDDDRLHVLMDLNYIDLLSTRLREEDKSKPHLAYITMNVMAMNLGVQVTQQVGRHILARAEPEDFAQWTAQEMYYMMMACYTAGREGYVLYETPCEGEHHLEEEV
jgi:hypothetical protein